MSACEITIIAGRSIVCTMGLLNWWFRVNDYWKMTHSVRKEEHEFYDQVIHHLPPEPNI